MSSDGQTTKAVGGIAPFGYRWQNGVLMIEESESAVRKLIYELFIKHKRKKTIAKLLNDLGYRTRSGACFSDTTIDRLIRDTTAKGVRLENGRAIETPAIVSTEIWQTANNFLGKKQTKQTVHLFTGFARCVCGGKMVVQNNAAKYACIHCRHKINADDLEEIFLSQLESFPLEPENDSNANLAGYWSDLSKKERRLVIEQLLRQIIIGATDITIEFTYLPDSGKTPPIWQQSGEGNETPAQTSTKANPTALSEPLMNEKEAARFLGISRMTLLRKRNANEIGFFRVGYRVLYSKEKHLIPFLERCER